MCTNPSQALLCAICNRRIPVESCKFDDAGQPVHEECYVEKLRQVQRDSKAIES